jgi:3-oxoacyl-[acyl-carrier protein] reductase
VSLAEPCRAVGYFVADRRGCGGVKATSTDEGILMLIDLTGRVGIVTGAGRGIGRELTLRLADEGAIVVGLDVDEANLAALATELAERGGSFRTIKCDVADSASVETAIAEAETAFGRIDILVNNAGVSIGGPIESLSEETWRRCHDINLTGTFLTCKAVLPAMKRQRSGRIINAASFAAIVPSIGSAAYASSKAAVAHFTRVLAGEIGPWNITANAYAPGMIPTQMNHFADRAPEVQERLLDTLTLRRWETPADIANLVCFLASDQAAYITGTLIDVSGGKLATQIPSVAYEWADVE